MSAVDGLALIALSAAWKNFDRRRWPGTLSNVEGLAEAAAVSILSEIWENSDCSRNWPGTLSNVEGLAESAL